MALTARQGLNLLGAASDTVPAAHYNPDVKARAAIGMVTAQLLGGEGIYSGGAAVVGDLTVGGTLYPAVTLIVYDDSGEAWFFRKSGTTAITFTDASGACSLYAVVQQIAALSPAGAVGGATNVLFVSQLTATAAPAHSLLLGAGNVTASAYTTYTPDSGSMPTNPLLVVTSKLGPPSTGTYWAGRFSIDSAGAIFKCSVTGSPGTWLQEVCGRLAAAPVAGDFNSGAIFSGYVYRDTTAHMTVYHDGSAFVETATPAASTTVVHASKVAGDTYNRFTRDAAGLQSWGPGSGAVDVTVARDKANSLRVGAGDQLNADNQLAFDETLLVDAILGILTSPANLRALWIMNAVTGTAITDRSPVGGTTAHPVTLSSDAANWAPTVYSKARALTQTGSLYWDTPDAADLTFVEPNPFSVMCLVNPSEVGSRVFLGKGDLTTGATQQEWKLYSAASKLYFDCFDDSVAGCYIGRNNAATTLTAGVWQTLCATKGVGATSADIKLYESGARTDDTNHAAGVYVAMEDKAAKVGSYTLNAAGAVANQFRGSYGLAMVVAEELTQAQILRMDRLLRSAAGIVF